MGGESNQEIVSFRACVRAAGSKVGTGRTPFLLRKLTMPNDVTVAGEKFHIFVPPGDCLRTDTVFTKKIDNAQ